MPCSKISSSRIRQALAPFIALLRTAWVILSRILTCTIRGQLFSELKILRRDFLEANARFLSSFQSHSGDLLGGLNSQSLRRLKDRAQGLHALLPDSGKYRYSILIPVYHPEPEFFRKALQSALDQSAPHLEILIGYDGPQDSAVYAVVETLIRTDPNAASLLKTIQCDREKTGGGISRTTNEIAQAAGGNYLLLMDHDDWLRPDLLYRYELVLRLAEHPENLVLYCNEFKINEKDDPILSSYYSKPEQPEFPYFFYNSICHCLLIPRALWAKTGGQRPQCDGAQDYDLCLRLDLQEARFQNVPFYLYAWRSHSKSTAGGLEKKDYATAAGTAALSDYAEAKGLDWSIEPGFDPTTYRAKPKNTTASKIQVIMPFKDQKDLTLKAIASVQAQEGVSLHVTAIDNGSSDRSIAELLRREGVEVLTRDEPFNYSRLNNLAVRETAARDCELLLFLNNDVELHEGALKEMTSWIQQPRVGMVGCRLHYPDGKLQHSGVILATQLPSYEIPFVHRDHRAPWEKSQFSRVLGVTEAVTAACALVRKDAFTAAGGFDEVFYPIAYSDTDLARKLRRLGYLCLYTPYASGTHYESLTRGDATRYEDFERSRWLYAQVENHRAGKSGFVKNSVMDFLV